MEEEMNLVEALQKATEENTIRKILLILTECKTLEEAQEKIKAML